MTRNISAFVVLFLLRVLTRIYFMAETNKVSLCRHNAVKYLFAGPHPARFHCSVFGEAAQVNIQEPIIVTLYKR